MIKRSESNVRVIEGEASINGAEFVPCTLTTGREIETVRMRDPRPDLIPGQQPELKNLDVVPLTPAPVADYLLRIAST